MKLLFKRPILLFLLLIISGRSHAQIGSEFLDEFCKSVDGVTALVKNMVMYKTVRPFIATLKIEVDKAGNMSRIELSDSADSLFKKTFLEQKRLVNIEVLRQYIKLNKIRKAAFLQQISITLTNEDIPVPITNYAPVLKFNNRAFTGKAIILPASAIDIHSWSEIRNFR